MAQVPQLFDETALRDPLFAAEGMDIENASRALDRIEVNAKELEHAFAGASIFHRLFLIRYPVSRYALPISFLRDFVTSERLRRVYVQDSSYINAKGLLDSWKKAAHSYAACVQRYRTLHDILIKFEPKGKDFSIQDAFGNVSSYKHVWSLLDALAENARALSSEVALRERLLQGADLNISDRKDPTLLACSFPEDALRTELLRLHELEIEEGVSPFREGEIVEKHGPIRAKLPHFDGESQPHDFFLYMLRDRTTGVSMLWIAALDKFLFTDVWRTKQRSSGPAGKTEYLFSGGLKQNELPLWYEPAGHLYLIRDQRYWMDIATAIDLQRRPELSRELVRAERSSMFDLLLGMCGLDLFIFAKHTRRRARSGALSNYSYIYGLLMRSFPSIYFLAHNASVWRLPDEPRFLGDSYVKSAASDYVPTEEVLSKLSADELRAVMAAQRVREVRERAEGWQL